MTQKFLLALLLPALAVDAQSVPINTGVCMNAQETELIASVNAYRATNGLGPIAISYWLSSTAQWHAWDLTENNPVGGSCNMHSWSTARPTLWQAVCYTGNGSASGMWHKPRQISGNSYNSNGYENAASSGTSISAATALGLWQNSSAHADVILNRGVWAGQTWRGMGVGIVGGYAVLWFGTLLDSAGNMSPCQSGGGPIDEVFSNTFG